MACKGTFGHEVKKLDEDKYQIMYFQDYSHFPYPTVTYDRVKIVNKSKAYAFAKRHNILDKFIDL